MKVNRAILIWGIVLILAGGLILVQNLGWIGEIPPSTWAMIFGFFSLLFFVTYFAGGRNEWGWLFPAFIFAGVATTIALVNAGADEAYLGAPVLAGIGLPFLAAYLVDRRGNRWALIPAFGLLVISLIPLLTLQASENMVGAFFLFAIAVPFWVIFLYRPGKWWAVIPAGVMTTLALVALISSDTVQPGMERWIAALLYLGIGATFGALWLRQRKAATGWAKYPAVILLITGVLSLIFGEGMQEYLLAAAIIALGMWILYTNLRPKKNI